MLIRPDAFPDDLPDEARASRTALDPGARGKPVPAAGGREGLHLHEFHASGL